ncbi:IS4 family transposase [soil metagenome]
MDKSSFFTGQPIFTQLLKFIPPTIISKLISQYQTDRYYKKFRTREHLVTMLYTCFHGCKSIREVITGMQVSFNKLNHLGMNCIPRRSTLSDANKVRSENLFGQLFHALYRHYYGSLPDSRRIKSIDKRLFIIDSTTVNLFSDVMKGMGTKPQNGKRKGGAKAHMLIKADEDVPRFVDLTHASKNDRIILEKVTFEKGSIVVFDKGYVNYAKWAQWTKDEVTWVTRIGDTASYSIQNSNPVSVHQKDKGVLADENITMGRASNKNTTKLEVRKITYKHGDRTFEFITNNMKISSLTIADIYKQRWQIELLFRRIKQSYPLKYFLGDSENAIKIQIWCALITDLLVKIVKDKIKKKKWSYANLSSMIRLHLMSYVDLFKFLNNPDKALINYVTHKNELQLKLYT